MVTCGDLSGRCGGSAGLTTLGWLPSAGRPWCPGDSLPLVVLREIAPGPPLVRGADNASTWLGDLLSTLCEHDVAAIPGQGLLKSSVCPTFHERGKRRY